MNQARTIPCVGVLLAGCGQWDGTDIHEAVLTLLCLDRAGATVTCGAPDMDQLHVLNHLTHEEMTATRRVAIESARLTQGDIIGLETMSAQDLDAVILPGGHGAIKHLSDFAVKGPPSTVHPDVRRLLTDMHRTRKPIAAISAAAMVVTRSLHHVHPRVTIGRDTGTASAIETMGGTHKPCDADQIHEDRKNHIVTTPGYIAGAGISQVAVGIEKLVDALLKMIDTPGDLAGKRR